MPKISEEMFDVRKLERFLNEGMLTPAQVEEHLASLQEERTGLEATRAAVLALLR